MDHLPSSSSASIGREGFQRPRAGVGFSGHGENDRGASSRSLSCPRESKRQDFAHDFFRYVVECIENETSAIDQQRATSWRTRGGVFHVRDRPAALRAEL